MADPGLVERYLTLGLRLGRHIDGMVDAYYGPPECSAAVASEPVYPPNQLVTEARSLLAAIDASLPLEVELPLRSTHRGRTAPLLAVATGCGPRWSDC